MINKNELPKNWEATNLGKVCDFYQGYGFPKHLQGELSGEYPFYKVGDISKNVQLGFRYLEKCNNFIDEKTLLKLRAKPYPKNTIVFAKIGEALKLNRRAIIKVSGIVDNNAIGLKAKNQICNDLFLFHFLQKLRLENYSRATTVPSVRKSDIEEIHFPLPPLAEQERIVAKIEELFSELDAGRESLKTAARQLKTYRQAVLKWAFEGKLTNENVNEGELPDGWKWKPLVEIADKIFDGPFGSNLKSNDYVDEGVRVIRLENIGALEFKDEYKTYVTEEKYESIKKHTVNKGDIIFSSFIADEIRVTILPNFIEKAINKADCFCVRTSEENINRKFLVFFLATKTLYNQLVNEVHGATRPRINTKQLKASLIPVCSPEEQQRIVEEIESRLSVCDKLEETINQSLAQSESLRQSILKQAFEGKLVNSQQRNV